MLLCDIESEHHALKCPGITKAIIVDNATYKTRDVAMNDKLRMIVRCKIHLVLNAQSFAIVMTS